MSDSGFPSMTALLGLLAVAGYQNRDKIAEMLGGLSQGGGASRGGQPGYGAPGSQGYGGQGSQPQQGGLGGLLGGGQGNQMGQAGGLGGLLGGLLGVLVRVVHHQLVVLVDERLVLGDTIFFLPLQER